MSSSELPPLRDVGEVRPPDTQESTAAHDGSPKVSPELALVDPDLAAQTTGGDPEKEVSMSSNAPSNGNFFVDQTQEAPALAPLSPPPPAPPTAPAPPQQAAAAPGVNAMIDVPLGTLIFRAGLLAEEQLEDALQEGTRTGKRLGEVLLERGWLSEGDLGRLLAGQKGLRFVELADMTPDPAAARLLPEEKARMQSALAIGFDHGVPVVAVADPTNELVVENVRRALGVEPSLVVASHGDLQSKIDETYAALATVAAPVSPAPPPVTPPPAPAPAPALEAVQSAPQPAVEPMPTVVPPPEQRIEVQPSPVETQPAPEVSPLLAEPPVSAPAPPEALPVPVQAPESQLVQSPPVVPQDTPEAESGLFSAAVEQAVAPLTAEPVAPTPEPSPVVEPTPAPTAAPAAPVAEQPTHFVVIRLGDEQIEIGAFHDAATARTHAQEVVRQIASAESEATWPFFADRFLRPATITSVDVLVEQPEQWMGSPMRASWASTPSTG